VIADMNAPDQDHWIALMQGMVPWPEGMLQDERNALVWPATWGLLYATAGFVGGATR
jgi:hypothetical protein